MRWLLRLFGYYKIEYGHACGRHWMSIDGKTIAQTPGDIWLRDDDVRRLVVRTIGAPEWDRRTQLEKLTCEDCEQNHSCEFAWDFYNTNGDCLAEK